MTRPHPKRKKDEAAIRSASRLPPSQQQEIAAALETSVTELLGEEAGAVRKARTNGPTDRVQKVFEEVSRLPRRQQEKIIDFVTAYVRQYQQSRQ